MIKLQAYLTGYSRKQDRSCSVRFETQELSSEALLELDGHYQDFGWLMFKENEFNVVDLPTEQAEDKQKTPAKRLRSSLFILAKQEGVKKEDFEPYYRMKMEKLIEYIQAKLDK